MSPSSWAPRLRGNKWLVAIAAMLATIMEVLDTTIANVALPHMQASFSASIDEITWVLTSYLVSNAIVLPLTGWLSALIGRKRFFIMSTVLFIATSMLCGLSWSLESMVIFRVLQGATGAALMPLSQAVLMEAFPPAQQGLAMAIWGVGIMTAPILGPTLGGWITDNYDWRWIFFMNLPVGALAVALQAALLPAPSHAQQRVRRIDYVGLVLIVLTLGCLQIVLDRGERADWFAAPWVWGFATTSVLAFGTLILWEMRCADPVVDLRLFRYRTFAVSSALTVFLAFTLFGNIVAWPLYLQQVAGYSAWQAGLATAPRGGASMIGMLLVGVLYGRVDTRFILAAGFALASFGSFAMARYTTAWGFWEMVWPSLVHGFGIGFTFVPLSAAALAAVPPARMENASGLFNLMRNTGASIGIAVAGTLIVRRAQVHQAALVPHVHLTNPIAQDALTMAGKLAAHAGAPEHTAAAQAPAMLYAMIQREAADLAFDDVFLVLAWVALGMLFVLPVIGKTRGPLTPLH